MDSLETGPADPLPLPTTDPPSPRPPLPHWLAALEVLAVTGLPTGMVVFGGLLLARVPMGTDGSMLSVTSMSLEYFTMSTLFDTALIALLIRLFLMFNDENSSDVFLGRRPVGVEAAVGMMFIPVALFVAFGLTLALKALIPGLHNVETNPLQAYMDTPLRATVFIVVATLGGGVREELQRAFILHRFEQRLGGMRVGWLVWSIAFGLLHTPQGYDAAIAVGALGLMWGWLYMRRRSAIAPMVSHAGFNALQVVFQLFAKL